MNPIALYFASGESFYLGALILILAVVTSRRLRGALALRIRNASAWLALAMMVMACPPFSWLIDALFFAVFVSSFTASNMAPVRPLWVRLRLVVTAALLLFILSLTTIEFSHRAMPLIGGTPADHLVVIGDSISSGIDPRVSAWPAVLQEMTGTRVKNLARPGAQTFEGLLMAEKLLPEDRLVLIEIGGNDLLAGVPSNEFGKALDRLLSKVSAPGRTVAMFELPLFPNRISYGQIQRRLARKYSVFLIPKRFFATLIGGADSTSDGLHLSDAGTRRMAVLVAQMLSSVLKSPANTAGPHVTP